MAAGGPPRRSGWRVSPGAALPPGLLLSSAALIAANLVPLGAVALGWWTTAEVIVLYWGENILIGLLNLARFGALSLLRGMHAALGIAVFFALHYGLFSFVHGVFVVTLFAPGGDAEAGVLSLIAQLVAFDGLLPGVLALLASHLVSFVVNFLRGGEYLHATPEGLMKQPYGRVVVLHLAILFGGAATMMLGEPAAALVLLVVFKIGLDLRAHLAEHRPLSPSV